MIFSTFQEEHKLSEHCIIIDLLKEDPDNDTSANSVSQLKHLQGDEVGMTVSLTGNELIFNLKSYQFLSVNEQEILSYRYTVTSPDKSRTLRSIMLIITGSQDIPYFSEAVIRVENLENPENFLLIDLKKSILPSAINNLETQDQDQDQDQVVYSKDNNTENLQILENPYSEIPPSNEYDNSHSLNKKVNPHNQEIPEELTSDLSVTNQTFEPDFLNKISAIQDQKILEDNISNLEHTLEQSTLEKEVSDLSPVQDTLDTENTLTNPSSNLEESPYPSQPNFSTTSEDDFNKYLSSEISLDENNSSSEISLDENNSSSEIPLDENNSSSEISLNENNSSSEISLDENNSSSEIHKNIYQPEIYDASDKHDSESTENDINNNLTATDSVSVELSVYTIDELLASGIITLNTQHYIKFKPNIYKGHFGEIRIDATGNWVYSAPLPNDEFIGLQENKTTTESVLLQTIPKDQTYTLELTIQGPKEQLSVLDARIFTVHKSNNLVNNNKSPIENNESSIENNESPIENNESSIENNESPIENNESPIQNSEIPIQNDGTYYPVSIDLYVCTEEEFIISGTVNLTDLTQKKITAAVYNGSYGELRIDDTGNWLYSVPLPHPSLTKLSKHDSTQETIVLTTLTDSITYTLELTIQGPGKTLSSSHAILRENKI